MAWDIPDELVAELQRSVLVPERRQAPPVFVPSPIRHAQFEQPQRIGWTILSLAPWFMGASAVVAGLLYVSQYGLHLKARVVQEGNAAIGNLVAAKDHLERLDLAAAQDDFVQASDGFGKARQELGLIGSDLGKILAKLPGGGSIRAAQDLIEAGRLVSDSGALLARAVTALSGSGNFLDPHADNRASLAQALTPIRKALSQADTNMTRATSLLAAIDASALPDDSRVQFTSFMERLPHVTALIEQGNAGVSFMERLVGVDQPRRYLLLFQNSSELRPTGGFPGSYGLVTFEDGRMKSLAADDIYNPDGQIKQLVVPPLQLQHITPSWGMRDANWFIDFPTSARKVSEYYRKGGGTAVDGVIAIRPEILQSILRITGPVSLPQYDLVLTADNFLATVQLQVESKKAAAEPKQIIMDLAPIILARLSSLPTDQWMKVLDVFQQGLAQRDMLMYMEDAQMQKYVTSQNWDGRVQDTPGDYLTVNVANIKGAKADAVTDTSLKLETWSESGSLVHRLTVTRQNNGGKSDYGFYNKTNYSYVRVLVPKGSTLRGISGNDHPFNQPMVDYSKVSTIRDPDLVALESTYQYNPVQGETTFEESGKTGFGFWMKIEPGKTQEVQLEYAIPARAAASDYRLYVQRQPGLDISDFEFTIQKGGAVRSIDSERPFTAWPDSWRLHDILKEDLDLSLTLR